MDLSDPNRRRGSDARAVAWSAFALGALALAATATVLPDVLHGSDASGCSGMVQDLLAGFVLLVGTVFGLPHAGIGLLAALRPAKGRRALLVLLAVDVLGALALGVVGLVEGGLELLPLVALFAVAAALGFAVVKNAPIGPTGAAKLGA
ncbi:MAG: hypothetical protein IPJ77_06495 [Planctomycetes bacterium]|nr:hypothetical protein [Planctomycetota bacterium]